jgi:vitamin B12/bleomycin/antimicrobial peptide transport system ATP-binding/permease protein
MEPEKPRDLRVTATRLAQAVAVFANSEAGWKAKWLFVVLLVLLLAANGLTVVNSFVGRNFMTAIADRREAEFAHLAILYVGVFAASTIVAVVARFAEERLGLLWRDSLTREMLKLYLANGAYSRLAVSGEVANPDQRIAEDVRALTASTLSFSLMAFNSVVTIVAFAGVMFSISLVLSAVAVLYAALGSLATLLLGRSLIKLNSDQLDKEASFRAALIHVKENAQPILLARQENAQSARLLRRLDQLIANGRAIVAINRNVGFFTTGYNWMIQIIPVLIMVPAYIAGKIEFGVITQSAGAFATSVAAFSLVVTQFQSLSALAAVMERLNGMAETLDRAQARPSAIQIVESEGPLTYESLTLSAQTNDGLLLEKLSATVPFRSRVLVNGVDPSAGNALFMATAGVWTAGEGRILRPRDILFSAQKPYLPPGSLRQVLTHPGREGELTDERIVSGLHELNLDHVLNRAGGLDVEQDWETLISLREQQLLAFLRVLLAAPQLVFANRAWATLTLTERRQLLSMLSKASIGYICNCEADGCRDLYDTVLDCKEGGGWTWAAGGSTV